ncbi:hypothetical protein CF651_03135 [Paenibacillus rigui]|uniref:Uncharacterized protein n=2 Tax=Paenibacillus rigui TaxID=554312 RepID=A0A229UXA2_9BACL|nr:hypothetical protein CF651_03135 [Paenibacillus rigui]
MDKRLTRSDYLFAVTFIFMLVFALGTFFFGLKMGQERSAAKYEELLTKHNEETKQYGAYHQQYLVSYYHTIYQPYREFHKKWFDKMSELESNQSADASLILKDLGKLSKQKYDELSSKTMPDSSPLLQEGLQNYAKSLKLFNEALGNFQAKANSIKGSDLVAEMEKDTYFTEAKKFSLAAQKNYYDAIIKWNETENAQLKHVDVNKPLNLKDWGALSLNVKNDYIAAALAASKNFTSFTPQDLTTRIDEMIASGQSAKMNLANVQQVIEILNATGATRSGDFVRNKSKWYANEVLPQLPFFFSQN